MKSTKFALLITVWSVFQAGGKNYTTVSVNRLIGLLEEFHAVKIKRRWLFYCLRDLIDAGIITRRSRFEQGGSLEINQLPSMITFTLTGLKLLVRNKISGAHKALKTMIAWLRSKDHRFPHNEDKLPKLSVEERNENMKRLKLLFSSISSEGT